MWMANPTGIPSPSLSVLSSQIFFFFKLLFNLYFTISLAGHLVDVSNLIAK